MKLMDSFYRWILGLMKKQPPRKTSEDELQEMLRKKKFYEDAEKSYRKNDK